MQRFTISLQDELAEQFDAWIEQRGYETRSEAVRDLLRAELERNQQQAAQLLNCVANLSYVYRFGQRELVERLARLQHDHHDIVVSTMQMQLDHEYRLETVMLRGATAIVSTLADAICAERGVHHGHLNLVSVTEHLSHVHPHQEAHDHAHHHAHHEVPPESHHQVHRHIHFKPTH